MGQPISEREPAACAGICVLEGKLQRLTRFLLAGRRPHRFLHTKIW